MANLSEALLRRKSHGTLCTGISAVDDDLASVHGQSSIRPNAPNSPSAPSVAQAAASCGVPERSITEVSGLPGSGKTAVALALILDAVRRGLEVLYVGCDYRTFPWQRVKRMHGWDSERFDPRLKTVYISSIEQLLTIHATTNTGLVVIEHYDTLIKRSWSASLSQRASNACMGKFTQLSRGCCVLVTAGCVKTQLHELIVPGPAVKIWKRPANMARLMIYKDQDSNHILSTGSCFQVDMQGFIQPPDSQRKPSLLMPELSSRKQQQYSQLPRLSQSPKSPLTHGLPTPASKRAKYGDDYNTTCRSRIGRVLDLPSSPFDRRGKRSLSAETSHVREPLSTLTPDSTHNSQHLSQPSQLSAMDSPHVQHEQPPIPSHRDAALAHPATQGADTLDLKSTDTHGTSTSATRGSSFLGLEIVPNSQVDIDDPDYLLQPSLP